MTTLTVYTATPEASDQLPSLQGFNLSPVSALDNKHKAVNSDLSVWPSEDGWGCESGWLFLLIDNYTEWGAIMWTREKKRGRGRERLWVCVRNGMTGRDSETDEGSDEERTCFSRVMEKDWAIKYNRHYLQGWYVDAQLIWAKAENSSLQNFIGGATLEARRGKHIQ